MWICSTYSKVAKSLVTQLKSVILPSINIHTFMQCRLWKAQKHTFPTVCLLKYFIQQIHNPVVCCYCIQLDLLIENKHKRHLVRFLKLRSIHASSTSLIKSSSPPGSIGEHAPDDDGPFGRHSSRDQIRVGHSLEGFTVEGFRSAEAGRHLQRQTLHDISAQYFATHRVEDGLQPHHL